MEVFFEILKGHFVFVHFGVLEAILYFVQVYVLLHCLEHSHDVFRNQVALFVFVQMVKQKEEFLIYVLFLDDFVEFGLEVEFGDGFFDGSFYFLVVNFGVDLGDFVGGDFVALAQAREHFVDFIIGHGCYTNYNGGMYLFLPLKRDKLR